jgi:carbon-monoxide dehydrogenase medium subunit
MLLRRFDLHRPRSLPEVFDLLDRHGDDASVIAGGTELLIALKARVLHYPHLISLKALVGLTEIREEGDVLAIGALASHHDIATHPLVRKVVPAYAELSNRIANIRVRCAGTLGGNLCFAEPHADPPAMLAALGASVRLVHAGGSRDCLVADFIRGDFETDREAGEIVTDILIPRPEANAHAAYRSFGPGERPIAGAAVVLASGADGRCASAELWVGALAGRPVALPRAAAAVAGQALADIPQLLATAALPEVDGIDAADDSYGGADYKRHLAATMLQRAAAAAIRVPV